LAIPSVRYSRLSKLILLAAQSVEIKQALDKAMMVENAVIRTTAFSTHPASMKYRGIFKLHSRKRTPEGMYSLNYFTPAGVHTLDRALVIWLKRYSKKLEKKTGDRNG